MNVYISHIIQDIIDLIKHISNHINRNCDQRISLINIKLTLSQFINEYNVDKSQYKIKISVCIHEPPQIEKKSPHAGGAAAAPRAPRPIYSQSKNYNDIRSHIGTGYFINLSYIDLLIRFLKGFLQSVCG